MQPPRLPTRSTTRRRARAVVARAALLALCGLAAVTACGDVSVGLGTAGSAFGARAGGARALVGQWARLEVAGGAVGAGYAYEVTWSFYPDGSAVRTTRTVAPGGAVLDAFDEPAVWAADGVRLAITFARPPRQTRSVQYRIEAGVTRTLLYLDGTPFTRVG